MLNKIQPRNSDTYSMTPFDFFEDAPLMNLNHRMILSPI